MYKSNCVAPSPKISVVVPVYNVEAYIQECIEHICAQTLSDFELILIDDGSTDASGSLCDDYQIKDKRIQVIHTSNHGVSVARNLGIDRASGEFIAFIDSDDAVSADYLERLYSVAIAEKSDLVVCRLREFENGTPIPKIQYASYTTPVTMSGPQALAFRYTGAFYVGPGGKLIAKRRLQTIRFPEGMKWEDQAVIPYVVYESDRVSVIEEELYFYRIHPKSASHAGFAVSYFDNILHMNAFISYLKEHKEYELLASAKKHRNNTLALYTIQARRNGITNIPNGCGMSELRAFSILRRNVSNNLFIWFLDSLHPRLVRPYAYFRKIESILTGKPLMGETQEK